MTAYRHTDYQEGQKKKWLIVYAEIKFYQDYDLYIFNYEWLKFFKNNNIRLDIRIEKSAKNEWLNSKL